MNIPEGCKPFDLQAALAGAKTICRDGSPGPVEFHVLPRWNGMVNNFLARTASGAARGYLECGAHVSSNVAHGYDLFMAPVEKEITAWAVVDKDGDDMDEYFASKGDASAAMDNYICRYPNVAPFSPVPLTGKWKG